MIVSIFFMRNIQLPNHFPGNFLCSE